MLPLGARNSRTVNDASSSAAISEVIFTSSGSGSGLTSDQSTMIQDRNCADLARLLLYLDYHTECHFRDNHILHCT